MFISELESAQTCQNGITCQQAIHSSAGGKQICRKWQVAGRSAAGMTGFERFVCGKQNCADLSSAHCRRYLLYQPWF